MVVATVMNDGDGDAADGGENYMVVKIIVLANGGDANDIPRKQV
jgi:hypothetical protein